MPMPMTIDIELLTSKEAARIAHVNQASIQRWVREHKLSRYGTPGKLLIDAAELREFLGLREQ